MIRICFFATNNTITVFHQNIAGLLNKVDAISIEIENFRSKKTILDVICLSEHFMKEGDEINLVMYNYRLANQFCHKHNRRGGTCILLRDDICYERLEWINNLCVEGIFECCGVTIRGSNCVVICIYRTPNANIDIFFEKLDLLLSQLVRNPKKHVIICGDFNIDRIKQNRHNIAFETILLEYNFKLQIDKPTRIYNETKTCIDNFALNFKNKAIAHIHNLGLSDHTAQTISISAKNYEKPKFWYTWRRSMSQVNRVKFRECINSLSFRDTYMANDTNVAFSAFHEIIVLFFDLCFPLIRVKVSNSKKPKWITPGIKLASKNKRVLYQKCIRFPSENNKKIYKTYASLLKRCINESHKITKKCIIC